MNEEAQIICEKNPSMLRSRSAVLEAAWAKVNESYQFKKGKSRSKCHGSIEPSTPKCQKINQSARLPRMKALEEDIKNIAERVSYKEKRRKAAEDTKSYRICDEITEEIASLSHEKRQLTAELNILTRKDQHSKGYYHRKASASCSSASPQSSRNSTPCPNDSETDDQVPAFIEKW